MLFMLVYGLFAAQMIWLAFTIGGWAWLLAWPALSFGLLALGYAFAGPKVMGKKEFGGYGLLMIILHAPFHLVARLSDALRAVTRRDERPYDEIVPGVWLGRRLSSGDDFPEEIDLVVDLCAEHARIPKTEMASYASLPTLDGRAPSEQMLVRLLERMAQIDGKVYVHCWAGRGRSATVVAAHLVHTGQVSSIEEALDAMRAVRPQVKLSREQRELLRKIDLLGV